MRSFLGLAYYYRRFVKGFSITVAPMTRLLQKNVKYEWSEKCQRSFDKLKAFLTEAFEDSVSQGVVEKPQNRIRHL